MGRAVPVCVVERDAQSAARGLYACDVHLPRILEGAGAPQGGCEQAAAWLATGL